MKRDPFKDLVLDEYEQELEDSIDVTKPRKKISKKLLEMHQEIARNTIALRKSQPITIRLNKDDLTVVKQKANEHAIPYQTLISSLIHRFARGKIRWEI